MAAIKKAIKVVKAVVTGVADYQKKNKKIHADALKVVGAEQNQMIDTIHRNAGDAPTPMGVNAFYGKAEEKAKQMKKEQGVSLRSSIRNKLGL